MNIDRCIRCKRCDRTDGNGRCEECAYLASIKCHECNDSGRINYGFDPSGGHDIETCRCDAGKRRTERERLDRAERAARFAAGRVAS